jgi:hypothetical protein
MKKFFKFLLYLIVTIVIILVLVGGYFGLVPGVSALFGSSTPKDLHVAYTQADIGTAVAKTGVDFSYIPSNGIPKDSIQFEGKSNLNESFSASELTALFANDKWEYNFLKDVQVKINPDGTAELSGILIPDRVAGFLRARRYPESTVQNINDKLKYFINDPTFYVKVDAGWQNNILTMDLMDASIGRVPVPAKWLESDSTVTQVVQKHVLSVPGLQIDSLKFEDGKMKYDGTFPTKIIWAQ